MIRFFKSSRKSRKYFIQFTIHKAYFIIKKNTFFNIIIFKKYCIFAVANYGALAQLARAFDWQSRGHEFDSHMLHKIG